MSRREKARLDEDKTAKPKTEIVGVYDNPDRNPQRRDRNIYLGHAQEYVVRDTAEATKGLTAGELLGQLGDLGLSTGAMAYAGRALEDRPNEGQPRTLTPWERGQVYGLVRASAECRIQGNVALAEQFMRMATLDVHDRPEGVRAEDWDLDPRRERVPPGPVLVQAEVDRDRYRQELREANEWRDKLADKIVEVERDLERLSVQAKRVVRSWDDDPTSLATENAIRELNMRERSSDSSSDPKVKP